MAQETNVLGNLKMLFSRNLKMTGVTGQFLPFKGFIREMRFMLEPDFLGKLDFLVLKFFRRMTTGLQASAIFNDRADRQWSIRIVKVGGEMTQAFKFGLHAMLFTGQEMTINAFSLHAFLVVGGVMSVVLPGCELFVHRMAGTTAKF